MADLKRCDECKRLSDESGVGFIGKKHQLNKYRDTILIIDVCGGKDLCGNCVKKKVAELTIGQVERDSDY